MSLIPHGSWAWPIPSVQQTQAFVITRNGEPVAVAKSEAGAAVKREELKAKHALDEGIQDKGSEEYLTYLSLNHWHIYGPYTLE